MMTLMFTVCLLASPTDCEKREMIVYEPMTPIACVMGAPSELAQWRETHPDWRITRWACSGGRTTAQRTAEEG